MTTGSHPETSRPLRTCRFDVYRLRWACHEVDLEYDGAPMPVPVPSDDEVLLRPPDAAEAQQTAEGIAFAAAPETGLTDLQRLLLGAVYEAMTDHAVDLSRIEPISAPDFAHLLRRRSLAFRTRGVQVMLLCGMVLRPLPPAVAARIAEFAAELGVDEGMIQVAERLATGSYGLAAFDFERNGYTSTWNADDAAELHTSSELANAWGLAVNDADLAARWAGLGDLQPDTLGRRVWELYQARGFVFPGLPGSAPPLLAQHDWVHVLADYGTTVESELEVFALIARANDDMRAFSLLAMVISLFETGYLRTGAGLFEASPGHLSTDATVAPRLADAMRRGALCRDAALQRESVDFMRLDWFSIAHLPLDEARDRFAITPKSPAARTAGSVGPWEPGGISTFQLAAGRRAAEAENRPHRTYGATTASGHDVVGQVRRVR
jgi:hypothetical protein